MPNLIMEYSHSVDERVNVQSLLEDLHNAMMQSKLFDEKSIKSRSLRVHQWLIGASMDAVNFIYVTVRIPSGISDTSKTALTSSLMALVDEQAPNVEHITVDIQEVDSASFKQLIRF